VKQWGPKSAPNPEIYWTLDRAWGQTVFLIVSSPHPAAQLAPLLRGELASLDRDLPMSHVRTLGDIVRESSSGDRAVATTVDFLMATALGLVAVGLYGTLSYCVLRRTREIGIRMAVGAERRSIIGLVFRQGFAWVVVGTVAGAAGSVALAAALRALIWGIDPLNAYALMGSAAIVAAAAILACWLPAWRAARVDPIVALRAE
jgi:ABC-type antimicrobial peptide transport system permease subunit